MAENLPESIRWRRLLSLGVLVVLLGLVALSLSQCRPVSDAITGVEFSSTAPNSIRHKQCTMKCDSLHDQAKLAERERHRAAIRACGGDRECRRAEHRLYRENRRRIEADKKDCKRACYNEGAVIGGR